MARAYNPMEILAKKYDTIKWGDAWVEAFLNPEISGVWFIWGLSANGKTSFVMMLIEELARIGKVFFNTREEGTRLTLQNNLKKIDVNAIKHNLLIGNEDMEDLYKRLDKRKSPQFIIIDSVQYVTLNVANYKKLRERYPNKLFIFISQSKGKVPIGRTADAIKFDADLKMFVEGFRAISNGRLNPGGYYTIWKERADQYWGDK